MKRVVGILLSGILMSGCGGGGSGGTSGGTSSSTSSTLSSSVVSSVSSVASSSALSSSLAVSSESSEFSSSSVSSSSSVPSSSSSTSAMQACTDEGVIFSDCVNSEWGALQVYEEDLQTYAGQVYTQGTNDSNLQWAVITSSNANRGNVIEATYGQKENVGSTLTLRSAEILNRSEYSTGKLIFDLNVPDFGESYNADKGRALFEVVLECVWPCTSHSVYIPVSFENVWHTVVIDIADLVRDGFDPSNVDTAFMVRPVFENASQQGVVFQLDNIRWAKGTITAPESRDVYTEHFNSQEALDKWPYVIYEGGLLQPTIYLGQGVGIYVLWLTDYDHWGMETTLDQAIDITNKKASFQVKLADTLVGSTGIPIGFSVSATDGNGVSVESEILTSEDMTGGLWHQFEIQLGGIFPNGFKANDVRKLAIHFHANGKPAEINGTIQIDTIRITE